MPPPPDMAFWLGQKYSILGKQAEGEYQRNIAEAGKTRAETGEIAPDAAARRALQGAQTGLLGEQTISERTGRFFGDQENNAWYDWLQQHGLVPQDSGGGAPQGSPQTQQEPPQRSQTPLGGQTPSLLRPPPSLLRPLSPLNANPLSTPLIKPNPYYNYDLRQPDLTESSDSSATQGYRKGSANVKAAKGSKGGKSSGKGGAGGQPQGLEQILPALMAASQAGQMGGGAVGPQAADGEPPPMAPGAAAPATQPPGMRRGMTNVMGYQEGTQDVSAAPASQGGNPIHIHILSGFGSNQPMPGSSSDELAAKKGTADVKASAKKGNGNGKAKSKAPARAPGPGLPRGLGAILPQLLAAAQQGGGGSPGAPPMAPGGPAPPAPQPPGMVMGAASVMDPRSAHSAPGYPFGAGYLFGATAVPGQGSGTVDKVPAMLAPHEAVLNRAAAEMLGRGKIAALNAAGATQMGLRRGAR